MRRWSGCEKRKGDIFFRTHCTSLSAVPWKMKNRSTGRCKSLCLCLSLSLSLCNVFSTCSSFARESEIWTSHACVSKNCCRGERSYFTQDFERSLLLQICDEEQAFCGCATAMDKMLLKLWTFVLYSSICFFFSQLTIGVAAVVMRRQFFPEEEMLLLKGLMMSDPMQQLVDPSSRSMSKYCTEPCTSLVFEISNNCHKCLAAHPQIHNYVQMAHWQLASDVLIALAYFSIPIELLFFIFKAQVPIANSSID